MTPSLRRRVLASLRPYRGMFIFALAQVVLISGAELLKPWPLKLIIDNVLGGQPLSWPLLAGYSPQGVLLLACIGLVGIYVVLGG
ncbi:MAG TPA: ABC transporter ATP-binding protein, partial [Candidatus Binatia bacterium]|nr:ABC transporter ATP-binding protein [Candidatus Binatia bacterium]